MKKKIKIKSILLCLLIILILFLIGWYIFKARIKNIYVIGNNYLKEIDIIEEANLIFYPKIIDINTSNIEKKLEGNDLIEKAKVTKNYFGKVMIEIDEKEILFKDNANNYYLDNGKIITNPKIEIVVPSLIKEMPNNDILDKFIRKYNKIDKDIRLKISEIEYAKDNLDNEKFLFYMYDGNYVYITLSKIELMNSYNDIYVQLGDNHGILYLDSGNHFQIKNNDTLNEIIENNE